MVKHSRNDGCLPCEESLSLSLLAWLLQPRFCPPTTTVVSLPFPFALHPSFLPSFLPSYLSKLAWCAWKGLVVSLLDADCERDNIDAVNRSRDIVTNRVATRGGIVYSLMNNGLEAGGTTRYSASASSAPVKTNFRAREGRRVDRWPPFWSFWSLRGLMRGNLFFRFDSWIIF